MLFGLGFGVFRATSGLLEALLLEGLVVFRSLSLVGCCVLLLCTFGFRQDW